MNIDIILAGFDASQIEQTKSVAWLLIGLLAFSAAVGVYNFLQMRKMQKKNRPKPNQLDGTIADEGISFYDLAGSPHVHTNITDIWDKDAQAIKKKSGGILGMGKTSQVTGYRYYAKFAAFIGNRIEKFLAINFDNRGWILHDPLKHPDNLLPIEKPSLYGEDEGGVSGNIDIHFGYPDQEPNAEYQKYFPLVSGYPYQSYLVFRGLGAVQAGGGIVGGVIGALQGHRNSSFYLGNSGYMKEMLLWVKRTRVRNDGRAQWYEVRGDGAVVCEIDAVKAILVPGNITDFDYITFRETIYDGIQETQSENKYYETKNAYVAQVTNFYTVGRAFTHGIITEGITLGLNANGFVRVSGTIQQQGESEILITEIKASDTFKIFSYAVSEETISGLFTRTYKFKGLARLVPGVNVSVSVFLERWVSDSISFSFDMDIGKPLLASEVGTNTFDINPIHKIREILTDDTSMGKPESDVNNANFMKAADRIWDEGLGVSWAIDEKSCIEAIEELCYHIEAGIRVNRQTGLYEMVLFRDDWFSEDEIHDIAENKIKDLSLEVMNSDDIANQLNVTYYDRERIKNSTFSVYENGSILTMGHTNAESVEFPYFMNMRNAEIVANWKLKQFSTPTWSGSFTTGWREARKWNRYDLIRLPWSKKWNGTILVRIMKINLGNGTDNTVTIDFEEVIPYSGEMNTSIVVDTPVDAGPQPPQPSINAVFEAPYYLTVLRAGQTNADLELSNNPDIGYVAAIAAKPQNNSLNALLYTYGGVGEFEQVSRLDYCDILQLDQPINETASAFVVTGSLTQTANSNNFILLNDELMGFVSFNSETKVLTVKRGVLDTIPKKHGSGYLFVFDLPDVAFDSTQYAQSEVVEAQVLTTTPSGIQELSTGTAIEIQSRAIRPYPPANVKINGEYWPSEIETDLILTWVDRNRVQQTGGEILSWFDNGVTLENGVTYVIEVIDADENIVSTTNVGSVNTFNVDYSDVTTESFKVRIYSVRDDFESFQIFEHTVINLNFISAPTNLTGIWNETTSAVDLTWEHD